MAWIHQVEIDDAKGVLDRMYQDSIRRTGRVWNIRRLLSVNPKQMRAFGMIYTSVMGDDSALTPRVRELLAIVTSHVNECHY